MNKPLLFVVGSVIAKGASKNTFVGTEKLVSDNVAGFTKNDAVIVPVP